jgi:hypothetical protein
MDGMIQGGWAYVGAAWGLSLTMFIVYVAITERRLAAARRRNR